MSEFVPLLDVVDQGREPFDLVSKRLRPIGQDDVQRLDSHPRGDQFVDAARVGDQKFAIPWQSEADANVGLVNRLGRRVEMRADAAEPHEKIVRHFPHPRRIERQIAARRPCRQQLERRRLPDIGQDQITPQVDVSMARKSHSVTGDAVLAGRRASAEQ